MWWVTSPYVPATLSCIHTQCGQLGKIHTYFLLCMQQTICDTRYDVRTYFVSNNGPFSIFTLLPLLSTSSNSSCSSSSSSMASSSTSSASSLKRRRSRCERGERRKRVSNLVVQSRTFFLMYVPPRLRLPPRRLLTSRSFCCFCCCFRL
jgi:hypothetical protein